MGQTAPSRILFGSCIDQARSVPILREAAGRNPDLFLFLGDNIYADTENRETMERKYTRLAAKSEFQDLLRTCPVMATWDDHDYGKNDAGVSFPAREMAEEVFLDFWKIPENAPERSRRGVYTSRILGPPGRRVQVLMLDTRFFRDDLLWRGRSAGAGPYGPDSDPEKTILGQDQWSWLKEQLREPAEIRIVATSIQYSAAHHGWESWANFPVEQSRMAALIRETRAGGVIFVSGDRHMAELSRLDPPGVYPLWDLTSSGLNRRFPVAAPGPNENRVGTAYLAVNFGEIDIDWENRRVELEIRDSRGQSVLEQTLDLDQLSF